MLFLGTRPSSGESEVHVLESLASLANSKTVLAPVLMEMWSCAQTLLTDGSLECFHCYLSTVAKVRIMPDLGLLTLEDLWQL